MAASPTTAVTSSPSTSESAALGLLIFDGDCGFCTTAARKFGDFAGESAIVAPWQALDLDDYGLTEADCTTAAYWVEHGENYRGADGIARGLRVCRQPWSTIGRVLSVPPFSWLARAVYPVVAKYRYKLPGSTDACRIPTA